MSKRLRSLAQLEFLLLFLFAAAARGDLQPVWVIGVDEDPFASGYNATDEFSSENYINDVRPGKVTRLPGDPPYNAGSNPKADDDFFAPGLARLVSTDSRPTCPLPSTNRRSLGNAHSPMATGPIAFTSFSPARRLARNPGCD